METGNLRVLWVLTLGFLTVAAILETIEGDYLNAAATFCSVLVFSVLAVGGMSARPLWPKIIFYFLVLLWVGLLAYRFWVRKSV
jgi:hypothetical protein